MLWYSKSQMSHQNPFYFRELPLSAPFCDRKEELKTLTSYAKSNASVVLYSPRRYGKTSLVKRVQSRLRDEGFITSFCDFFGTGSVDDVAARIARSIYEVTHHNDSLFKQAINLIQCFRPTLRPNNEGTFTLSVEPTSQRIRGIELLESTLQSLERFVQETEPSIHLALDEFQEITELPESHQVEGLLRQYIQRIPCSFFFIGSRRRVLLNMFNDRSRPFYQSSVLYKLSAIDADDFEPFITERFLECGKICSESSAQQITQLTHGHPYYTQKLCFFLYEQSASTIEPSEIHQALREMLSNEQPVFEATLQGLAPRQISLLNALAISETASPFAAQYIAEHNLGSTGAIQGALKKLSSLDLIEQLDDNIWHVTDPLLSKWLRLKNGASA